MKTSFYESRLPWFLESELQSQFLSHFSYIEQSNSYFSDEMNFEFTLNSLILTISGCFHYHLYDMEIKPSNYSLFCKTMLSNNFKFDQNHLKILFQIFEDSYYDDKFHRDKFIFSQIRLYISDWKTVSQLKSAATRHNFDLFESLKIVKPEICNYLNAEMLVVDRFYSDWHKFFNSFQYFPSSAKSKDRFADYLHQFYDVHRCYNHIYNNVRKRLHRQDERQIAALTELNKFN